MNPPREHSYVLSAAGLQAYDRLRGEAVEAVIALFRVTRGKNLALFGDRGIGACRADIESHLDFLRPVLETGLLRLYVDYLVWFSEVHLARQIPCGHLGQTLDWIGDFFVDYMPDEGPIVAEALSLAFDKSLVMAQKQSTDAETRTWPQTPVFEAALLRGDRPQAVAISNELQQAGRSLAEVYVHLIQASLVSIGKGWQHNEVSIAQEHLAATTAVAVMADGFMRTHTHVRNGKRVILACVEGNGHDIGLRMASDVFELNGWQVQCLGADTPTRSLVEQIRLFRPDVVGLSVSLPVHLSATRDAFRAIREALVDDCPRLLVGGAVINRYPELAGFLGADANVADVLGIAEASLPA